MRHASAAGRTVVHRGHLTVCFPLLFCFGLFALRARLFSSLLRCQPLRASPTRDEIGDALARQRRLVFGALERSHFYAAGGRDLANVNGRVATQIK